MHRFVLTDTQWAKMQPLCLGKPTDPGRTGGDNHLFLEAVLWIARTGSPWRDLPPTFGNWNTVFKRYRDWVKAGVFKRIFDVVSWSLPWSMRQSSKSIATRKEQKGDQKSGDREVEGRLNHQNPRADRRAWELGAIRPAPRPSL